MRVGRVWQVVFTVIFVVVVLFPTQAKDQKLEEKKEIKLGLIYARSEATSRGAELANAVRLALSEDKVFVKDHSLVMFEIDSSEGRKATAAAVADLMRREGVRFFIGPEDARVMEAVASVVSERGGILLTPAVSSSSLAGVDCIKNVFIFSLQREQLIEVLRRYLQNREIHRVAFFAEKPLKKENLKAFTRIFDWKYDYFFEISPESDEFASSLTWLNLLKPEAVVLQLSPSLEKKFLRFVRRRMKSEKTIFLTTNRPRAQSADEEKIIEGLLSGASWETTLPTPENKRFVEAYRAKYGAEPGSVAAFSYDAFHALKVALAEVGDDLEDVSKITAFLKKANFASIRGEFIFGNNSLPIQSFYLARFGKGASGGFQNNLQQKIYSAYGDSYAAQCLQ